MAHDQFPTEVDVIVLGTGLPESILAAACARSGLSVLHLDRNDFYGGQWSSFNLRAITEWQSKDNRNGTTSVDPSTLLRDGEHFVPAACRSGVKNIHPQPSLRLSPVQNVSEDSCGDGEVSASTLDADWRKFSLDLLPKLLLSRGEMVKLLCDSTVAKYCEFKCVDRILNYFDSGDSSSKLHVVPVSRSEVFTSDYPSLQKRRLMRFLQLCMDWRRNPDSCSGYHEYADRPLVDFLDSFEVNDMLKSFLADSIAILHPQATTTEGLEAICKFIESVGRYGNSPFLCTLYGSGELPQCFCRLCAVFGGIYCLDRHVDGFVIRDGSVVALLSQGHRIDCKHIIMNFTYAPLECTKSSEVNHVSRAIVISDRSLLPNPSKENISLLNLTRFDPYACTHLIEAGFEACVAPKGKFVSHLTAKGIGEAHRVLRPIVDKLYSNDASGNKPQVMWSLFYDLVNVSVDPNMLPKNMRVVPGVHWDLDYSQLIDKCKTIFEELWPDRDFLPMALDNEGNEEVAEDAVEQRMDGAGGDVLHEDGDQEDHPMESSA